MGWYSLPSEKEAPAQARAAYARDKLVRKAECVADLVAKWRVMAETLCCTCNQPIGWDVKYVLRDRPQVGRERPEDMPIQGKTYDVQHFVCFCKTERRANLPKKEGTP